MTRRTILAAVVAAALPACGLPAQVGIHQPDAAVVSHLGRPSCAGTASLRPTLRWEPFAGPDVTYELRIASAGADTTRAVVYARDGLTETLHAVEDPLEPSKKYLWTVRARILVGGETRYTAWGAFRREQPLAGKPDIVSYCFETPAE